MVQTKINIGVIGDYDTNKNSHIATNAAISHGAKSLSLEVGITWIPTSSFLTKKGRPNLEDYDGIWASPGSPYKSLDGALEGIRMSREKNQPFIGT
jgi:CTP synthase (UTP-ammonia lyase)